MDTILLLIYNFIPPDSRVDARLLGPKTTLFGLEVFVGGRRETLVSLAFCRGP